jgi:hypothetical protein
MNQTFAALTGAIIQAKFSIRRSPVSPQEREEPANKVTCREPGHADVQRCDEVEGRADTRRDGERELAMKMAKRTNWLDAAGDPHEANSAIGD